LFKENQTYLLTEVMVDKSGLHGQTMDRVDGTLLIQGWILRSLVDGQQIELGVIPFVQKHLGAQLLDDHIPGVVRASAAHDGGQNLVGGEDIPLVP